MFGEKHNRMMILNGYGEISRKWFKEINNIYSNCKIDEFVIMPNHVQMILKIIDNKDVGADLCVCPLEHKESGEHTGSPYTKSFNGLKQ